MAHLGQHNELRLFSVLSDPHLKTLRPLRGKVLFFDHVGHRDSRGRRTRRTYIREARLRGATIRDTWDPDARGDIHTHYRIMGVDQIPRRKADRHPHWRYITFPSFEDFIVNCDMQAAAFIATARHVPRFLPRPRSEMVQLMMINTPESLALYKLRLSSLFVSGRRIHGHSAGSTSKAAGTLDCPLPGSGDPSRMQHVSFQFLVRAGLAVVGGKTRLLRVPMAPVMLDAQDLATQGQE
ncbi:hypothetical protein EHS25_004018 [Saitozyma podzolica]|uniref:Uncharacterized protein n=1 Tax=Saitozyma podzolica TaxID=1890683 RepID=A0A427YTA5_9TREE|nr:hypothetical protein EHS25_004018 [Saitozyma podzolica]